MKPALLSLLMEIFFLAGAQSAQKHSYFFFPIIAFLFPGHEMLYGDQKKKRERHGILD